MSEMGVNQKLGTTAQSLCTNKAKAGSKYVAWKDGKNQVGKKVTFGPSLFPLSLFPRTVTHSSVFTPKQRPTKGPQLLGQLRKHWV